MSTWSEPGVLLVNPSRSSLKINDDIPAGWQHFTRRGWEVFDAPPSVTINSGFSVVIINVYRPSIIFLTNEFLSLLFLFSFQSLVSYLYFNYILFYGLEACLCLN